MIRLASPCFVFRAVLGVCLCVTALCLARAGAAESFETARVRPAGSAYVPPPFRAVVTEPAGARCVGRRYGLSGVVPTPDVSGSRVLGQAFVQMNGARLQPPAPTWVLVTPAVAVAERSWTRDGLRLFLRQTVEYDGFVTTDLTLTPTAGPVSVHELAVHLRYLPERTTLYHIPVFRPVWAGAWPERMEISKPIVGVWGGDERAGFAAYVATFRDWSTTGPWVVVSRDAAGSGSVVFRVIDHAVDLRESVTFRFGFIATPVWTPKDGHWRLFSVTAPEPFLERQTIWGGMSDFYATFRTNTPDGDDVKAGLVDAIHGQGKAALAYTTYDHVEEGAADIPEEWWLTNKNGAVLSRSIGGGMADRNRVFLCPGSPDWVEWKTEDLRCAIERYGVDGFYVDTTYVILPCANHRHDHGWVDASGQRQSDYPVWSMREIWRRSYELLCQARGKAAVHAHHKGGCPAALAAFTSAFSDGEQFTSQSIKTMTLDAFRSQCTGRTMGPFGMFLNQYYRSAVYGVQQKGEHHNPTESLMLALPHDVMAVGYPGLHPVRELLAFRDDLGLADASWTPYYSPAQRWRLTGAGDAVVSSYTTARGDTVLVLANPTYGDVHGALTGPEDARRGRVLVSVDVLSRLGRSNPETPGYRWEEVEGEGVTVAARSFSLLAFVREPTRIPRLAEQCGFIAPSHVDRSEALPEGAHLVSDFDDSDWVLVNDDGGLRVTTREPVRTSSALRVSPKPRHAAAALLKHYPESVDWRGFSELTFWIRPDHALPVRSLQVRLRNSHRWGPSLKLSSHDVQGGLSAGQWVLLRYGFGDIPRDVVQTLRIYFHRGELNSGPFDLDEVLLHSGAGTTTEGSVSAGRQHVPVSD